MIIKVFRGENVTEIKFKDDATSTTVYLEQCHVTDLLHKLKLADQASEKAKRFEQEIIDRERREATDNDTKGFYW